jgi:predicted alpha/beta hydrolase
MGAKATTETIEARDGQELVATIYLSGDDQDRVVIVSAATGVKQAFYEPYARFLANNRCAVITFDYRGIGKSLKGKLSDVDATIRDWGQKDYPAVIEFAKKKFPGKKIQIVGHSVGGQLVGMLDNVDELDSVITVAAQHGYHWLYPLKQSLVFGLLWWILMPLLSIVYGYFPSRKFGLGESLPKGVALEWARFCRSPNYFSTPDGEPIRTGFAKYTGPVRAYSFADDDRAPEKCVRALHAYYEKTKVDHRHVDPKDFGGKIGHVGFFLAKFKESLWRESLEWLRAHP